MKTLSLISVLLLGILFSNVSMAQTSKKETIKVWGNCGMCKKKIEKAAKSVGANSASWDADKLSLEVAYNTEKTSSATIQEAIAKIGYDTQDFRAADNVYSDLPGCCQYERAALSPAIINATPQ